MELMNLIKYAIENNASDIHITVGIPPVFRIDGVLKYFNNDKLFPKDVEKWLMRF